MKLDHRRQRTAVSRQRSLVEDSMKEQNSRTLITKTRSLPAVDLAGDESTKKEGLIQKIRSFFVISNFPTFVMNDFDLVFGILERESVKQPLTTKTRSLPAVDLAGDESTKKDGLTPARLSPPIGGQVRMGCLLLRLLSE
jgi:hypothetical protein